MEKRREEFKEEVLTVDTQNMSELQVRLLKRVTHLLSHTLTTQDEAHYFEGSSELFKLIASSIKEAHFGQTPSAIPYATQALEYALDNLVDEVKLDKIIGFDN